MHLGAQLISLGLLLLIASVVGRAARRIGLPAIPVYMVVGLLASPNVALFPINVEPASIELVAIFGLILLLFNLGVEFDIEEFARSRSRLLLAGGTYIAINLGFGLGFGFLLGWGAREALLIAGITATSSSAIVTKLLIELGWLANDETPMVLGITVVEDIFIALYLAVVGVVLSDEANLLLVALRMVVAFAFIIAMFVIARRATGLLNRLLRIKDDELFVVLFFGLLLLFAGFGEEIGVTDAIGAFLVGLVLGSTQYRERIEHAAVPMRDVFGAFFFVNFGLSMDPARFPGVLVPVLFAVAMTVVLNLAAGQIVALLQGLGPAGGFNAAVILQNRGEFALILATMAAAAGLDPRITAFAGLYVLIMAIWGPITAGQAERITAWAYRRRHRGESAEAA